MERTLSENLTEGEEAATARDPQDSVSQMTILVTANVLFWGEKPDSQQKQEISTGGSIAWMFEP